MATKKVESWERSTGMGATHFAAVLVAGKFETVSRMAGVISLGRRNGENGYRVTVDDVAVVAHFHRSNSGKEHVRVEGGPEFESFDLADEYAAESGGA